MPDFASFGTEAMTPAVAAPKLPSLPQAKRGRPSIAAPARPADTTIDEAMPTQKLDKPALQEKAPPAGDEDLVISPDDDRYQLPSTPYQNTPGDDAKDWPQPANLSPRGGGSAQPPAAVRAAIEKVAAETGASVPYLLATAERESSFNPNSGGSGSISGLYQATGGLQRQYGIQGDAEGQTRGYVGFLKDLRRDMGQRMGRAPTDAETYMGHHFGASRGAGIASGQIAPDTPVSDVFTPNELRLNPHIVKAGTVGWLKDATIADMERRMGNFRAKDDVTGRNTPLQAGDFAKFGAPAGVQPGMDPNLAPIDQDATRDAQIPAMLKGAYQPKPKAWDDAVASMPKSQNIDDRRGEVSADQKALGWAKREMGLGQSAGGTEPTANDRVQQGFSDLQGDFAQYGEPAGQ